MDSPQVRSPTHRDNSGSSKSHETTTTRFRPWRTLTLSKVLKTIKHLQLAFLFLLLCIQLVRIMMRNFSPPYNWELLDAWSASYRNVIIQSPSLFCSEFGRELSVTYDMDAKWILIGVMRCLRLVHPHQAGIGAIQAILTYERGNKDQNKEESCKYWANEADMGNLEDLDTIIEDDQAAFMSGEESIARTSDIMHAFKNDSRYDEITERLSWFTVDGKTLPVSRSLAFAIKKMERRLIWTEEMKEMATSEGRLIEGDTFSMQFDVQEDKHNMTDRDVKYGDAVLTELWKYTDLRDKYKICGVKSHFASKYAAKLVSEMYLGRCTLQERCTKTREKNARADKFDAKFYTDILKNERSIYNDVIDRKGKGDDAYFDIRHNTESSKYEYTKYDDMGTAIVNVLDRNGGMASGVSSLYDLFGALHFGNHHIPYGMNNLRKILLHKENHHWQLADIHTHFDLVYAPLIAIRKVNDEVKEQVVAQSRGGIWGMMETAQNVFLTMHSEQSLIRSIQLPSLHYHGYDIIYDKGFPELLREIVAKDMGGMEAKEMPQNEKLDNVFGGIQLRNGLGTAVTKAATEGEFLYATGY